MCVNVCACVCMCVHVCACVCMCVHVCACVCMCVHVRVHATIGHRSKTYELPDCNIGHKSTLELFGTLFLDNIFIRAPST